MLLCSVTLLFLECPTIALMVVSRSFFLPTTVAMLVMTVPFPFWGSNVSVWRLAVGIILLTTVQILISWVFLVELHVIVPEVRL